MYCYYSEFMKYMYAQNICLSENSDQLDIRQKNQVTGIFVLQVSDTG